MDVIISAKQRIRIGNSYRLETLPYGTQLAILKGWKEYDKKKKDNLILGRHAVVDNITWIDEDGNRHRATPIWVVDVD